MGKVFIYTSQGIMNDDLCSLLAVVCRCKDSAHDDPKATEVSADRRSWQSPGRYRLPPRYSRNSKAMP